MLATKPAPGLLTLRRQIARRAVEAGAALAEDDLCTTIGATEGLFLALRAIAKPGDVVAVESPAYFGVLQGIESLGLRALEIPAHPRTGLDVAAFEEAIRAQPVRAVVVSPTVSNPLGAIMPEDEREKLVRITRRAEIAIIEDDVYGELVFDGTRPRLLRGYAGASEDNHVVLVSSVSKTLAPGYRVGWVAGGRWHGQIVRLKYGQSLACPALPGMAVAEFLASGGYDRHLRRLRAAVAGNVARYHDAIASQFPEGTRVAAPRGGYVLWVELPARLRRARTARRGAASRHRGRARPAVLGAVAVRELRADFGRSPLVRADLRRDSPACEARRHGVNARRRRSVILTLVKSSPGYETTIGVADATTPGTGFTGERRIDLQRGTHLGRYTVESVLGRGGMGVVYLAHDSLLDRRVALKLLHSTHAEAAERLGLEAQALAKLDDPHVVAVYDAGEIDGQVFLAMQYIDGEDLARALARRRPPTSQIMGWFVEAGRGLAAAHAVGLVHRDFKPSNVLIDRRGRVAVTDFGLARTVDPGPRGVTRMGSIMGTPAYMSPEQHALQPANEASDQFSFCVALWEALFGGQHPYIVGDRGSMSPFAIGYAIYDGDLIPPPRGNRVPRRALDAIIRGLSRDPAKRWPSMTALIAELAPPAKRRIWPLVVTFGALTAAGGAAAVYLALRHEQPATVTCDRVAADRIGATWSAMQKTAVAARFAATKRPYAKLASDQLDAAVDRYSTRWQSITSDVCKAERASTGAAPELVVRKRACLDSRLDALRVLVTAVTGDVSPELVDNASQLGDGLPDLGDCADSTEMSALPMVPPAIAAEVGQLELKLDAALVRGITGDYRGARDAAAAIVKRADELGYVPLQAHAYSVLGRSKVALIEPARKDLVHAAELAIGQHLDRAAASALALAAQASGTEHALDALETLSPLAKAAAARTGDRKLVVGAEIATARGLVHARKWRDGSVACHAAYADALRLDSHTQIDDARDCLIEALTPLGETKENTEVLDQIIADRTKDLGPDHPQVATYLDVRAHDEVMRGELAQAHADAEHALDIIRRVYGDHHFKVALALDNLAYVIEAEGKTKDAIAMFEQALAMTDESRPEQLVTIAGLHTSIAMMENSNDEHAKALEHFAHAVELVTKGSGPNSLELAFLLLNYGQIRSEDSVDESLRILGQARDILASNHDKRVSAAGTAMGIVAYNAKRFADARKFAEATLADLGDESMIQQVAMTKNVLARSLVETHGDKARARTLMTEAKAAFQKLGPNFKGNVKASDEWLKKHP